MGRIKNIRLLPKPAGHYCCIYRSFVPSDAELLRGGIRVTCLYMLSSSNLCPCLFGELYRPVFLRALEKPFMPLEKWLYV